MLVRLLAPLDELPAGVEAELSDHRAISLIQLGFAVPVKPKMKRAVKAPVETRKK